MGKNDRTILDRLGDTKVSAAVMDALEAFPERMRYIRRFRKLTLKALAEAVGMKPCTLSEYEHGNYFPDMARLTALAVCLDVSTDWLTGRDAE